jgi:thiol-disulfide isomerase/thioredoxin
MALLVLLAVVALYYLRPFSATDGSKRGNSPSTTPYRVGEKFDAVPLSNRGDRATLVLFVNTSCHYCTNSMPFYRRLAAEGRAHATHLAVVGAESLSAYMLSHDVATDGTFGGIRSGRVAITPTLILLDGTRVVRRVWAGRLPTEQEADVIRALPNVGQ